MSCRPTQSIRHNVDLTDLYDSADLSDVTLNVVACDGAVELNAHRVILVAGSSFMRSALSKEWLPNSTDGRPAVSLQTKERLAHCESLVKFLYGLEIELDLESAHPLLRLADSYALVALTRERDARQQHQGAQQTPHAAHASHAPPGRRVCNLTSFGDLFGAVLVSPRILPLIQKVTSIMFLA